MMKFLITGATGFVGQALLSRLIAEGHDVVVLSRSRKRVQELGLPVTVFEWDAQQSIPPKEAFTDVQTVIHLAGESVAGGRWTKAKKKAIFDSRIVSTRLLVEGIAKHGKNIKTFICSSAIGFYGSRGDELLDENSERGTGFLSDVCVAWELEALKASSLVRTVCLRTGMVIGDGGALRAMAPIFKTGLGGVIGRGAQWVSWIHLNDLVSLVLHLVTESDLKGPVNGVAPNPITNRQFTKTLAKVLGGWAPFQVPESLLRLMVGELSTEVTSSRRIAATQAIESGFSFSFPDIEMALKQVWPSPSQKNEQHLAVNQWIDRPVDEVFPFFADVKNLEKITPTWLNFKVLGKGDEPIQQGRKINYSLKIHGIPLRWQSLIDSWDPNRSFVDCQTKGPYKLWHHTHKFLTVKKGTLIIDDVRYEVPGGLLGSLVLGPWIRSDLKKIFNYRRRIIEEVYS